jgi:hypothetical protein
MIHGDQTLVVGAHLHSGGCPHLPLNKEKSPALLTQIKFGPRDDAPRCAHRAVARS